MTKQKDIRYSDSTSRASLWQFKTVIETGDLRYLLILDDYDQLPDFDLDLLTVAWQNIYQEFSDIAGGQRANLWLLKVKRLTALQLKLQYHSSFLRVVQAFPHPELIELINDEGYNIDPERLEESFRSAYSKLMKLKGQISMMVNEQKKDEAKNDMDGLITALEKFQGYQFDEHKMTVKKFVNIYKKYKDGQTT